MISLVALPTLALSAVLIAPTSGADEGCPSARQVNDAMQARFPQVLVNAQEGADPQRTASTRAEVLRPLLDAAPDGTVVRFWLLDARGESQLRRALAGPGHNPAGADCLALADTIAAIVERYLAGIAYNGAPASEETWGEHLVGAGTGSEASPPKPRALLSTIGGAWRTTTGTQGATHQGGPELGIGLQWDLTRGTSRLAGQVAIAAAPRFDVQLPDGIRQATTRRFPLRIGLVLAVPAGPGWVDSGLRSGTDLLVIKSTGRAATAAGSETRLAPVLEATIAYRLRLGGRFFVRPGLVIGVPLAVYDIRVPRADGASPDESDRLFQTPRAYASFVLDVAAVFQ